MNTRRTRRLLGAAGAGLVLAATLAAPAPARAGGNDSAAPAGAPTRPLLAFDEDQAGAANGPPLSADSTRVCGDDQRRFLGELLQGSPFDYKIPYRLGDVAAGTTTPTARLGKQWHISGTADSSSIGSGDFPFDHPYGSDFNMDLVLDEPFADLSQVAGVPTGSPMHIELSAGQFPHVEGPSGPAAGMEWDTNSTINRSNLQTGYVPAVGERVLVTGRWVNDCGHPPFQTEIHPVAFLARAHVEADTTVAQAFYAPYRETQVYNPAWDRINDVNDDTRFTDANTKPFPEALVLLMAGLQDVGPWAGQERLKSSGLLEANHESPVDWLVCAPEGTSGDRLDIRYDFATRPGVQVAVVQEPGTGCARVSTELGTQVTPDPTLRECVLPWDYLNEVAGSEAGVPDLDLQVQLGQFLPEAFRYRLDAPPLLDCYNPVRGPSVSNDPAGQNVTVVDDLEQPFIGRVEVAWADNPPSSTTSSGSSSSSSSSSSSTSSSSSSSSSTTSMGTNRTEVTVSPATVAQGGVIRVTSRGWDPGSMVTVDLDGVELGTATADDDGSFSVSFTVPSGTPPGRHDVRLRGTLDDEPVEVATEITVVAATVTDAGPIALPRTGAQLLAWALGGAALVAAGAAVVLATRRSRLA